MKNMLTTIVILWTVAMIAWSVVLVVWSAVMAVSDRRYVRELHEKDRHIASLDREVCNYWHLVEQKQPDHILGQIHRVLETNHCPAHKVAEMTVLVTGGDTNDETLDAGSDEMFDNDDASTWSE